MYLCTRCASCPQRPAGCIRTPGTIVTENCGHPGKHREQNPDSGRVTSVLVPQITFLKFSPFLFPCQHRVLTYELWPITSVIEYFQSKMKQITTHLKLQFPLRLCLALYKYSRTPLSSKCDLCSPTWLSGQDWRDICMEFALFRPMSEGEPQNTLPLKTEHKALSHQTHLKGWESRGCRLLGVPDSASLRHFWQGAGWWRRCWDHALKTIQFMVHYSHAYLVNVTSCIISCIHREILPTKSCINLDGDRCISIERRTYEAFQKYRG